MSVTPPEAVRATSAGMGFASRAAIVAVTLCLEKFLLNFFVDFDAAQAAQGLGAAVRIAQHWGFYFAMSFVLSLVAFVCVRDSGALHAVEPDKPGTGLRAPRIPASRCAESVGYGSSRCAVRCTMIPSCSI
jgi:hypothetical protein